MFVQELKKSNFDFEKLPKDLRDAVDKLLEVPVTKEDSQKVQLLDYTIIKSIANLFPENEAVANIYNSIVKMEQEVLNDGFNTELIQGFSELEVGDKVRNAVGILLTVVDKNETEYILHSNSNPIPGNGLPWDKNKVHDYITRGLWTRALKTTKMAKGGAIAQANPVIDKNAIYYHGSPVSNIEKLGEDIYHKGADSFGVWFTNSKENAKKFATYPDLNDGQVKEGKVYEVQLDINNPLFIKWVDFETKYLAQFKEVTGVDAWNAKKEDSNKFRDYLIMNGFDSVVFTDVSENDIDNQTYIVTLSPSQIKVLDGDNFKKSTDMNTHISNEETNDEYAYGGEIHKETPGMERNTGNRPSPSAHASHHEIGTEAIGNDGNVWEVKADKNGTHAWKKTEKATANTSPQKSIHDLHELDLWVQFPNGRFYRKFVLNKDNFRAIADLGIKESITGLDNGMVEAIISVRDEAEAEKVSLLFMELYPVKSKESEKIDPKNNVKINNNDLNKVIDIKKPTGLLRHKPAAIEKIKKNAVRRFYSTGIGAKEVSVEFWQELKPGDIMSSSIFSFEVYDTSENSTDRIFALNKALLNYTQMMLYSEYRAMFEKAFYLYYEFQKQKGNEHNLVQDGYDYAIEKLKSIYNFTPEQVDWINNEIQYMAQGIVDDFLTFVNHKIGLRYEIENLGKLKEKKEEAPEVIIGYTAAPEAYDYNGAETLEVTEYFDDSNKPIRKVSIQKKGLKPQTDRYKSGGFGFFSKEEVEQIFAMGEHSIFKKKQEKKIDITAFKNPYELNRGIEAFLDANWDKEEFTADEMEFISYYSGYGGLDKIGTFSKEEFKTILYEFFTPDDIVKKMWALAYKYGYGSIGDNSIFEPSVGIGAFLKYAPKDVRTVANEINKYSAKICEILYPNALVKLMPFEKNFIKNNLSLKGNIDSLDKYSLVIGNPPYGKAQSKWLSMGDDTYVKAGNFTEYFISRGLDLLMKDGLLCYIVGAEQHTGGTLFLDSGMSAVKESIFEKAELIDAYRLPINVFERTGVSSEILIFKRK